MKQDLGLFLFCEDQKRVQNQTNVCFLEKVTKHSSSVECINTMIGNLFCLTDVSITNGFQEKVFNNIVPIIEIFFRYIFGNFY